MKFFLSLLTSLLVAIAVFAQPCSQVDKLQLPGNLKFTKTIPPDLFAICINNGNASDLYYDSLTVRQKRKYKDVFTFAGVLFSSIRIQTDEKRQVVSMSMMLNFDSVHHTIDKVPVVLTNFYNRLVKQYGNPSYVNENNRDDPYLKKLVGVQRYSSWDCQLKSFSVNVIYGAETKGYDIFAVQLNDKGQENPPVEETIAN